MSHRAQCAALDRNRRHGSGRLVGGGRRSGRPRRFRRSESRADSPGRRLRSPGEFRRTERRPREAHRGKIIAVREKRNGRTESGPPRDGPGRGRAPGLRRTRAPYPRRPAARSIPARPLRPSAFDGSIPRRALVGFDRGVSSARAGSGALPGPPRRAGDGGDPRVGGDDNGRPRSSVGPRSRAIAGRASSPRIRRRNGSE